LGGLEDFVGFWRRHDLVGALVEKALDQRAFIGFAGCYGPRLDGIVPAVEPEVCLAGSTVRPVAGEAIFGKDGANIAVEFDFGRRGSR
jgi:hypothetical protein